MLMDKSALIAHRREARHDALKEPRFSIGSQQFIPQSHPFQPRGRFLDHLDHFRAQLFAGEPIALERAEKFHEDAPFEIIGMNTAIEGAIPAGPVLGRAPGGKRIGDLTRTQIHILRCDRRREQSIVNHLDRGHPGGRHLDDRSLEAILRPKHLFHRLERRSRNHILFADLRLRNAFHPCNVHHAGLGRIDLLRMRTIVKPLARGIGRLLQIKGIQFRLA